METYRVTRGTLEEAEEGARHPHEEEARSKDVI